MDWKSKINSKLTKRDKHMITILVIFVALVGYYQYVIQPLVVMNNKAEKTLFKAQKKVLLAKTKISERASWEKDYIRYLNDFNVMLNSKEVPFESAFLPLRVKAVMTAASNASVEISGLRPIREGDDGGGSNEQSHVKAFSVVGYANIDSFLSFLRNLWGVELDEVSLDLTQVPSKPLKFYIKITFLSEKDMGIGTIKRNLDVPSFSKFLVKNNPFVPKARYVAPKKVHLPPPPPNPPPSKPRPNVRGAKLIGVAEVGARKMAIVNIPAKKLYEILYVGDKFRDSKVSNIGDDSITFVNTFGQKATLKLMLTHRNFKYSIFNDNTSNASLIGKRKNGRLGFFLASMTPELAKKYKIGAERGILVLRPRKGGKLVKKDDVITSINGISVNNFSEAVMIMQNIHSGQTVNLGIIRHGKKIIVSIKAL